MFKAYRHSSLMSTHRKPSGAAPGGEYFEAVQSCFSSGFRISTTACMNPTAAIAQTIQKKIAFTSIIGYLLSPIVVWFRRRASGKPGLGQAVAAPARPVKRGGTNYLQWLAVRLFLEGGAA